MTGLFQRVIVAVAVLLVLLAASLQADEASPSRPTELLRAAVRKAKAEPTAAHVVATIQLASATEAKDAGEFDETSLIARISADDPQRAAAHEWLCWRLMPVGYAGRERFKKQLEALQMIDAARGIADRAPVFPLYLAALERDRDSMLRLAGTKGPTAFPSVFAERCVLDMLAALGVPKEDAALHVLTGRRSEPLHGLADLDRELSREIAFLKSIGRGDDAAKVESCRGTLRKSYLQASRHTVERLFALNLLGMTAERDALVAKQAALEEQLAKLGGLGSVVARVDSNDRWSQLIAPMLAGDLAITEKPPRWITADAGDLATTVRIDAKDRRTAGNRTHYTGGVTVTFGDVRVTCDEATAARTEVDGKPALTITGAGRVTLKTVNAAATANEFTFSSRPASFKLAGDVVVTTDDQTPSHLTAATLTLTGQITTGRSLLDDWKEAKDLDQKLALVPALAKFDDRELPDDAKFLVALKLIEPDLTWYAPYAPPKREGEQAAIELRQIEERRAHPTRWGAALGREPWMVVPAEVIEQAKAVMAQSDKLPAPRTRNGEPAVATKAEDICFWRMKSFPLTPDNLRAYSLLKSIKDPNIAPRAHHWAAEIRRNNTVLTLDIAGGYPAGLDAPVVLDARNADAVTFKLYRVTTPSDLLAVAEGIGADFIFRDYGLHLRDKAPAYSHVMEQLKRIERFREKRAVAIRLRDEDLVESWDVNTAELPWVDPGRGSRWSSRWDDGDREDDWYFGDSNDEHRARLDKEYRPSRSALSSWRTDRVATIPAKALAKPGAYILVASANGIASHAPIIVDPLSMTLRRSRDGVLVMAADSTGRFPTVDADVIAPESLRSEKTDRRGAAFLRVHAAGDRPIVIHKDGRYAIGGFGDVFEGVYRRWGDRFDLFGPERIARLQRKRIEVETLAQVYDDRTVIAAYTDRPTYRPGQQVQFKLIMRQLAAAPANGDAARLLGFRAEDFDLASHLTLPRLSEPVQWEVIDPRGRSVLSGNTTINDFGTAIGAANLTSESAVGRYSLRITSGGMARVVPDVFAVKYYRRPNFELKVEGVPAVMLRPSTLTLQCAARYYFGEPVTDGTIDARLVRVDQWKPLAQATAKVGPDGRAAIEIEVPKQMAAGQYAMICTLTDASGRSVSTSNAIDFRGGVQVANTSSLPALPRFVAVNQDLVVRTGGREVVATVSADGDAPQSTDQVFLAKDGAATIKLSRAGWHRIQSGDEAVDVFAYGTEESAIATLPPWETEAREGGWVNLTDAAVQEQTGHDWLDDPSKHLYALFERHHALVGDKLRVLVYCPVNQPRLLLTIEGRTVIDYIDTTVAAKAGRYHVIEVPIKPHYGPNFYLQGRVLGGAETPKASRQHSRRAKERPLRDDDTEDGSSDPRWCRVDVIDPNRKPGGERLTVRVEPERTNYRPGEEVGVRIAVTDVEGKPREAEVSLAAVDESVFTFGEDALGSLASVFGQPWVERRYQSKAWRSSIGAKWSREEIEREKLQLDMMLKETQSLEAMKSMVQSMKSVDAAMLVRAALDRGEADRASPLTAIAGKLPVTSLALGELRRDFRETAAWHPRLRTDAQGLARTVFKLPDSLTAYRLTAVGLTRGTEIGVGRSSLRASMPVSVQVFLPRFAVENDRHEAVALVHNSDAKERMCVVRWEVIGATSEAVDEGWTRGEAVGKATFERRVTVQPGASARVALRLTFGQVGDATVSCRVTDRDTPADRDGEERVIAVSPLGRPVEYVFDGTFRGEHRVELPAGFTADDVKITLSRNDVPHALDGLGYLVEYPHGCVEQTMSRFLPAVMVRHAVQKSAIALPSDVAAKLPEVLAKGLDRLYAFQHDDGGFGWYSRDTAGTRDDAMTIYVMYGLARCKAAGIAVNDDVLMRGCLHLAGRIKDGGLGADAAARAWYVIALAGKTTAGDIGDAARAMLKLPAEKRPGDAAINLALACREAGQADLGQRLWVDSRSWKAQSIPQLSLKLLAQSAFGEPVSDCYETARLILAQRQGHRWAHTRDTSWALEAMTELVHYARPTEASPGLTVMFSGKNVLTVAKGAKTQAVERVHLRRGDLANLRKSEAGERDAAEGAGTTIVLKSDGDDPFHFAITIKGVERLEHAKPHGEAVKMVRLFESLDGEVLTGPVKVGEVIAVRLTVDLAAEQRYVIVEDRRAGGLEFADDRLRIVGADGDTPAPAATEFRDDRLCVFFDRLPAGRHNFIYYLRAESAGTSHVLPGCAYPMYAETHRGETGTKRLEVR